MAVEVGVAAAAPAGAVAVFGSLLAVQNVVVAAIAGARATTAAEGTAAAVATAAVAAGAVAAPPTAAVNKARVTAPA